MIEIFDRHDQTQACRNLLAAVVQLAVTDACSHPLKRKKNEDPDLSHVTTSALTAMRFLFDEDLPGLNEYATWLDFDPGQFRRKLQNIMHNEFAGSVNGFSEDQRTSFCFNYTVWRRFADQTTEADFGEDND